MANTRLIIVSGISGSGKSTALKTFEDLGFHCVDNLPAPLVPHFIDLIIESLPTGEGATTPSHFVSPSWNVDTQEYVMLVDYRDDKAFSSVSSAIERLKEQGVEVSILFLDCQDEILVRRYRETRRPHPLLISEHFLGTVVEAIEQERSLLADFREAASLIIDSSSYSPQELRRRIEQYCNRTTTLEIFINSFGYKYGVPFDADLLIDVRFLPNPHYIEGLRPLTGGKC